jgi:N4-gp56 family major capsid protein
MAMRKEYIYSQAPLVFTPPQGVIGAGNRGSAVNIPFYHGLPANTTALSQTQDITPRTFTDNLVTVTPDLYGDAVQIAQKLSLEAFTDIEAAAAANVAEQAARTRDYLARVAACSGSLVMYGGDALTRATVTTASTTDELAFGDFLDAIGILSGNSAAKIPGPFSGYAGIMSRQAYLDQVEDGNIILLGEYGSVPFNLLNGEIGAHIAGVRLIVSDFAKVFHGAGASGTASSKTLTTEHAAGTTTLGTTSALSTASKNTYMTVGAVEATGADNNPTVETVFVTGGTGTTSVTIIGGGPNGGLLYVHSSAEYVQQAEQVHASVFFGAEALGFVYTNDDGLGPDGVIYPPEVTGLAKQFNTLAWKGFWGFGRISENRLVRFEHAVTRQRIGQ